MPFRAVFSSLRGQNVTAARPEFGRELNPSVPGSEGMKSPHRGDANLLGSLVQPELCLMVYPPPVTIIILLYCVYGGFSSKNIRQSVLRLVVSAVTSGPSSLTPFS